jgi:hypothetical protein
VTTAPPASPATERDVVGIYVIRVEPHGRRGEGYWALAALSRPDLAWAQAIRLAAASPRATITLVEVETQEV